MLNVGGKIWCRIWNCVKEMENKVCVIIVKVVKFRIIFFKGMLIDWVIVYIEECFYSYLCGIIGKSEDVNRYFIWGYWKGVFIIWNKVRR